MKKMIAVVVLALFIAIPQAVLAGEKATPQDIYAMVINAYEVLKNLGDEGLVAFNDPKGEFVFKDSYVYVMKCPGHVVAHPFALSKLAGRDLRKDFPFQIELCNGAQKPEGAWVEYMWPKRGEKDPSRKIAFVISVEGTPYQVAAGIYNDEVTVAELNASLN